MEFEVKISKFGFVCWARFILAERYRILASFLMTMMSVFRVNDATQRSILVPEKLGFDAKSNPRQIPVVYRIFILQQIKFEKNSFRHVLE